jgi:quercetin dioxygenase-like cupin family protein
MKLVALDAPHDITQHGSIGAMVGGLANLGGWSRVVVIQLEPGGVLGMHPATVPQLLLVVDGRASVRSGENPPIEIAQGQGVLWEEGEPHETASGETGLTAISIEAESIDLL